MAEANARSDRSESLDYIDLVDEATVRDPLTENSGTDASTMTSSELSGVLRVERDVSEVLAGLVGMVDSSERTDINAVGAEFTRIGTVNAGFEEWLDAFGRVCEIEDTITGFRTVVDPIASLIHGDESLNDARKRLEEVEKRHAGEFDSAVLRLIETANRVTGKIRASAGK